MVQVSIKWYDTGIQVYYESAAASFTAATAMKSRSAKEFKLLQENE